MKKTSFKWRKGLAIVAFSLLIFGESKSQVIVEADGGVGYSLMNMEAWSGKEPEDWSQFAKQFNAQVLYRKSNLALGLSYGFHDLCWSYVRIPYGYSVIHRTYEGKAQRVALLFRVFANNTIFDFHGGAYLFDGYTSPGVGASVGQMIRLNDRLSLPIKLNWATIFDSESSIMPISLTAGISYQFY